MRPIRVLLADDSTTIRRLLTETLSKDPLLEVCHAARDGQEAVTQFPVLHPDVVVLDVEMPVMDGIEAVIHIRRLDPHVPILMFSSLTTRGGEATLDALSNGATDFVTKPTRAGHLQDAIGRVQNDLIPIIKHWGKWYQEQRWIPSRHATPFTLERRAPVALCRELLSGETRVASRDHSPVEIVAIGVSTGGPKALADLLTAIPNHFPIPILIVQHMPPLFTGLLADRLNNHCPLTVREAIDGAAIEPGHVWLAPGDSHLLVDKHGFQRKLRLDQSPPENSCRPSVDVLFRSVASAYREKALAVVLTGMGQDGLQGCQQIHSQGGRIIVQDQASSVVWGMPRVVAEAGLADRVLPLDSIANELIRLSQLGRALPALVRS